MKIATYPLVSDWITLRGGWILVHSGKVDIGQRISTALRQIVIEELGLKPQDIKIAPVRTDNSPDEGITSGSNSIEQSGGAIRLAAATLRHEITGLAARRLAAPRGELRFGNGVVGTASNDQQFFVLDLLHSVSKTLLVDRQATITRLSDAIEPGPINMIGLCEMVSGRYKYLHDIDLPGMFHARNIRPPHAFAILEAIDQETVESIADQGISVLRDGSYVAVAGADEWAVVQAAQRLIGALSWRTNAGIPQADVFSRLKPENAVRLLVQNGVPQPGKPVPQPLNDVQFSARYERPYQMHGALAPAAALALWNNNRLDITSHSQGIFPLRDTIAEALGLEKSAVIISHAPGSGCYGHNGADDAAFEAALIARLLPDTPVLLKWSRQEEHCWEPYGPAMAVEIAATMTSDGRIDAYSAEVFSDTHRGRPRPGPNGAGPSRLLTSKFRVDPLETYIGAPNLAPHGGMHRNLDPAYAFPTKRLVKNLVAGGPLRTSAMRGLGSVVNVFALESFMDEIRGKVMQDPIAYRLAHLDDIRSRDVLERLRELLSDLPNRHADAGRGIAFAQYKNAMTRTAVAADLRVADDARVTVDRLIIVADAGRIVDRDGVVAQLEGGAIQAMGWALKEQVHWNQNGVQSCDWDSYPVIRFGEIPEIYINMIDDREARSTGVGEASCGPTVAAIANAIYDAAGVRVHSMPFNTEAIRSAAAATT